MIRVLIFTLRSSQKTLFLNGHLFRLSCRRSQRCISSLSFYSNDFPVISEPGKNRKHVARSFGSHESPEQSKKQDGIPADASSEHHHTTTILQRLHDLEKSFRVRGHSVLRWGLCALVVTGFVIYIFREPLRENVADEMADVASRSLADENVIQKADEVTRAVLQDVLHDPGITKLASAFVMEVLNRDDVRSAAIQLTHHVLSDPSTLKKIAELAKSTLSDLLTNDETRVLLLSYLKTLILDQGTKDACKLLLGELVEDPDVKGFMATSLGELVTSSVVKNSAAELGKSVTHQVVNDADIQQETGNFLWRAVKKTFTPGWFG